MKDKIFVDTNIFVYFLLDDEKNSEKKMLADQFIKSILNAEIIISTQVINELCCILSRYNVPESLIQQRVILVISRCNVKLINLETIKLCWNLRETYKYSYWDSLILSSALQANCSLIYSEDMQHNQLIQNKIKIINPLIQSI